MAKLSIVERFEMPDTEECVCWHNGRGRDGRGRVSWNGRKMYAYQAMYLRFVGSIPAGYVICHQCDNPRCVNPRHLVAGTQSQNMLEMWARGRRVRLVKSSSKAAPYTFELVGD